MGKEEGRRAATYRVGDTVVSARPLEPALYLVATPIGNLGDITLRALETLAAADVVACEDTRVSRILLDRYGISARPFAYHEHNAADVGPRLIEHLGQGKSVALVSDAGTPLVSDPGYRLAQLALEAGHKIVPLPGASATLAALVGSGLPNDAFFFAGFLPHKEKARRDRLSELKDIPASLVFFESPHRVGATLAAAADVLGDERRAAVCRELTKTFEEFRRGTLADLAAYYQGDRVVKGEIVLVIGPPLAEAPPAEGEVDALLIELRKTLPVAKAASEAARRTGLPRKDLYQRILSMRGEAGGEC